MKTTYQHIYIQHVFKHAAFHGNGAVSDIFIRIAVVSFFLKKTFLLIFIVLLIIIC